MRQISGWIAVSVSTAIACIWASWGILENFHEGWYEPSIWRNICLMLVQYMSPMLVVMLVSLLGLRWPRLALPVFLALAVGVGWFFRHGRAGITLITIPLVAMGLLYHFGRPEPRRWAWGCLIGLPLITAIACGAYPCWMAVHRFDDGNYGIRRVEGNGVTLVWAPEGPGWPARGVSWYQAAESCAHLTVDGSSLASSPQNVWRLPTADEAVRSLVFRGNNAGGTWDSILHRAQYRTSPDKDSPLWRVHSMVIYWWTDAEVDANRAYYISNNGSLHLVSKKMRADYLAFRCVTEPARVNLR